MPPWLPGVLTAVVMGLLGNYLSVVILVKLQAQAMQEHARRLALVEDHKLDAALHASDIRRIDERLNAADTGIRSAGHRMNGIDQRITAVDDRVQTS